jgi:IS605 OrfB family transposase
MKQVLTIVCKLQPTKEQVSQIEETLVGFANACNHINNTIDPKLTNAVRIQTLIYHAVRELFGLSANLAIRAIARVSANRKTAKQKKSIVKDFKPTSIDYDARIFDFREKDWTASITLIGGRQHIKMDAGNYQRGKLKDKKPTSATLCKHKDGNYYIHIQIKDDAPEPSDSESVIGIDLGRRDIAVTSDGDSWSGEDIQQVRDKFCRVRASLQKKASKGTRSTRRRSRQILKRLSGREQRYQSWLNHTISRTIVNKAKSEKAAIAIEDLTGIRERTNQQPKNKTERRRSNSWAFYQLRQFLEYKAIQAGVSLVKVNPAYTSQMCHNCQHIHPVKGNSYRSGKTFKCGHCGWKGDADLNGALNIAIIGAFVSKPRGSGLSCSLSENVSGLPQDSVLLCAVGESPVTSLRD